MVVEEGEVPVVQDLQKLLEEQVVLVLQMCMHMGHQTQ
jgi:hypothetical protein